MQRTHKDSPQKREVGGFKGWGVGESSLEEHTRNSQQQRTPLGVETVNKWNESLSFSVPPWKARGARMLFASVIGRSLKTLSGSQSEKATYCMIPIIWHSGKGKTMETVKRSVVGRGLGEGMNRWSRAFSGQWNHSVWYHNDGYICPDSWNIQQLERTLMWTMDSGW